MIGEIMNINIEKLKINLSELNKLIEDYEKIYYSLYNELSNCSGFWQDNNATLFFEDVNIEITIHEGRNHQVKRMFEAVSKDVVKLKRERIAFLDLTGLASGEYRKLSHKEVSQLYVLTK